jgi:hypothetical protein
LLATRIGDVTVSPTVRVWTEFEVRNVDGRIQIAARKGDLTINDDTGTAILEQGQQTTREESQSQDNSQSQNDNKKKKKKGAAAGPIPAAASGGVLNSPVAIGIGGGVVLGVTAWVLLQGSAAASPSK